jgi:hypothetical protein
VEIPPSKGTVSIISLPTRASFTCSRAFAQLPASDHQRLMRRAPSFHKSDASILQREH